nr:MAG TPA: hypothetical protein [Caudoviricetes sp.]DAS27904.1 MAG TPA: hypothetical protein [Caudoviricetes sp.]
MVYFLLKYVKNSYFFDIIHDFLNSSFKNLYF